MNLHEKAEHLAQLMGYNAEAARERLITYYRGENLSFEEAMELRKLTIQICANGADYMSVDDFVAPEPVVMPFGDVKERQGLGIFDFAALCCLVAGLIMAVLA